MSTQPGTESVIDRKSLDQGVETAKNILGQYAEDILSPTRKVTAVTRQLFQSRTFSKAGFGGSPGEYEDHDGTLLTVSFDGGAQALIISAKAKAGPYAVGSATTHGIDLRPVKTLVYDCDPGKGTMNEIDIQTGERVQYTWDQSLPAKIKQSLGTKVRDEYFE